MSPTKIESLTPEQEALISVTREKWRAIALSTQPINHQKAAEAVKAAYAAMGKAEPEILFLNSPEAVRAILTAQSPEQLARQWGSPLLTSLLTQLSDELREQLDESVWRQLETEFSNTQLPLLIFMLQDALMGQEGDLLAQLWIAWQQEILQQMWEQQQAELRSQLLKLPGGEPLTQLGDFLWQQVGSPLSQQLEQTLWQPLANQPWMREWEQQVMQPLLQVVGGVGFVASIGRNVLASSTETIDFCISVLDCHCDRRKWDAHKALVEECGWVLQLEHTCVVCDRPIKLSFDTEQRLHAEGEPAIAFADGSYIYAYQGVRLPERYGRSHPNLWRSEWLLTEQNAELRRVLIQGIGYSRICQELDAIELDWWREYTLLRIENEVDVEPIHLLKMTCPSTGYIHATRVPPDIYSARKAIRWVNWGVDAEEFSVET